MFEKIYRVDEHGQQKKIPIQDLQIMANQGSVSDLNLIYRSNTKSAFAAFRLMSFISTRDHKKERVTKFLVEIGTYDASKPKGMRQKEYVQIYLDEHDFSYFCNMMNSGRMVDLMRQGVKVPYKHHSGTDDAKRLRVYPGTKMPIILEAAQGPGVKGNNGQTLPDNWDGANKPKVRKTLIALSEEEAFKIGSAGLRAVAILDMWRAFGRDEENLALINVTKKKTDYDKAAQGTQGGYGYTNSQGGYQRNQNAYRNGYAARQSDAFPQPVQQDQVRQPQPQSDAPVAPFLKEQPPQNWGQSQSWV